MGTSKRLDLKSTYEPTEFSEPEYLALYYRKRLLSCPTDESRLARQMWTIVARNRRFCLTKVNQWKLKAIKDDVHRHIFELYEKTLDNAVFEFSTLKVDMSTQEFLEGYQAMGWNSHGKYPTIFDALTESIEVWHDYHIGTANILDKEMWVQLTGDKLKWPKRRYGTKNVQEYKRPFAIRRHFPFETKREFDKQFLNDAGVFKMFGKQIPDEVKKIYV